MSYCTGHVRFQRESGHARGQMSAFAVAIGCKADIRYAALFQTTRSCLGRRGCRKFRELRGDAAACGAATLRHWHRRIGSVRLA
jgi:hypothetical protein